MLLGQQDASSEPPGTILCTPAGLCKSARRRKGLNGKKSTEIAKDHIESEGARGENTSVNDALVSNPYGFGWGLIHVIRLNGRDDDGFGIGFSILRMRPGETQDIENPRETAVLLLTGDAEISSGCESRRVTRASLFNESPSALHCAAGAAVRIRAESESEFAVFQAANPRSFPTRIFDPSCLAQIEDRGKGILDGTAHRIVRTIFDVRNRPGSDLVLGEVVAFPGRWSSYPPHHHPQPEIYHYRFTRPQGYGHAELGERVFKVRQHDTLLIRDGQDHPQVAAPGYGMYYIWVIRHLPGNPYQVPEFTEEHRWANVPGAGYWKAQGATE